MRSAAAMDVPNDVQRDRILRFLYDRHRSARGPAKIPIGIRDLQGGLKQMHAMSQQEVTSHLDYLVQVGWVREVAKERSFTTPKGMEISKEQITYKISDVGTSPTISESSARAWLARSTPRDYRLSTVVRGRARAATRKPRR